MWFFCFCFTLVPEYNWVQRCSSWQNSSCIRWTLEALSFAFNFMQKKKGVNKFPWIFPINIVTKGQYLKVFNKGREESTKVLCHNWGVPTPSWGSGFILNNSLVIKQPSSSHLILLATYNIDTGVTFIWRWSDRGSEKFITCPKSNRIKQQVPDHYSDPNSLLLLYVSFLSK